ncbi:MAG: hypothetical protein DRN19_01780 [Thermoplasmata archaeon]|nr:MAG: hypothetical protein DRN19_01780 [Thermoplasmata archaeon]
MNDILPSVTGITEKSWAVSGEIKIGEFFHVVLSFDHDLVDGAVASRFTGRFAELLEEGFGL